jgi:uncharacterized membrane protein (UPF0127 family)
MLLLLGGCSRPPSAMPAATTPPTAVRERPSPSSEIHAQKPSAQDADFNIHRQYQLFTLERVTIKAGKHSLKVWVMDTQSKRMEGMMFLSDEEVKADEGMLFVFAAPEPLGFWMKNTYIPLDIAYMDARGRILNVAAMKPLDETPVRSRGAAKYALEMKQGSFKRLGIRPGMRIEIPQGVRAKDEGRGL